jgi:hypothetical protein
MQDSSILDQTRGRQFFGPGLIQEAGDQVCIIKENLRVAQTRQKSYADNKRRPLATLIIKEDHWNLRKEIMCTSRCHHLVECGNSRLRANCPLVILDHSEFLGELERWPIKSSYLIIYLMCIMYSMCLNVRSVSVSLRNSYQWKSSVFRVI